MYSLLFLILGFVLLYYGGEFLVKGSVNLANKFNISKLVAGMTIVSFAVVWALIDKDIKNARAKAIIVDVDFFIIPLFCSIQIYQILFKINMCL